MGHRDASTRCATSSAFRATRRTTFPACPASATEDGAETRSRNTARWKTRSTTPPSRRASWGIAGEIPRAGAALEAARHHRHRTCRSRSSRRNCSSARATTQTLKALFTEFEFNSLGPAAFRRGFQGGPGIVPQRRVCDRRDAEAEARESRPSAPSRRRPPRPRFPDAARRRSGRCARSRTRSPITRSCDAAKLKNWLGRRRKQEPIWPSPSISMRRASLRGIGAFHRRRAHARYVADGSRTLDLRTDLQAARRSAMTSSPALRACSGLPDK